MNDKYHKEKKAEMLCNKCNDNTEPVKMDLCENLRDKYIRAVADCYNSKIIGKEDFRRMVDECYLCFKQKETAINEFEYEVNSFKQCNIENPEINFD